MPKSKTQTTYRRADTGEYTNEDYAKKHPDTTVKETDKVGKKTKATPKEEIAINLIGFFNGNYKP